MTSADFDGVMSTNDVCVIILCYGDRIDSVTKVVESVLVNNPGSVLVVMNCVSLRVKERLISFSTAEGSIVRTIESVENIGSAGGYGLGISHALENSSEVLFWLLDDDNSPEPDALRMLLLDWNCSPNREQLALTSGRSHEKALDVPARLPRNGTCIGFHFLNLVRPNASFSTDYSALPFAPYGGFFIPRGLTKIIGLPNPDYFLYADDLDWTYRISKIPGGRIRQCAKSKIVDLDSQWFNGGNGLFKSRIFSGDALRIYYDVRNRTYFNRQHFPGTCAIYLINKVTYLFCTLLICLLFGKIGRFKTIYKAILDGENGRLGRLS